METVQLKTATLDGKKIGYCTETEFTVQIGKGKGSYRVKYSFRGQFGRAVLHYNGLNVHSGYKKRLVMNDKVLARQLTY